MAIKKPITKRRDAEPEEDEVEETPKARLLKKKQPAPEPEEEEEDPEVEEEKPAKKSLKKVATKSKKSFAELFDATKPGRGIFPLGDHKMKIIGFELEGDIADEGEDQGELKAKVTYEGLEDEAEGKTISSWYNLCSEDGDAGPGIPFLKGDLDVLGYEDVTLEDLQEIFDDIVAEEPEVIVKVKQNGQYTNAFLQGLAEGE